MDIINTYQTGTIYDRHRKPEIFYARVSHEGMEYPVRVLGCPKDLEKGDEITVALNRCRDGEDVLGANFISEGVPEGFEPRPIEDYVLIGYIEEDMQFIDTPPEQNELEQFFSHTNSTYLYVGLEGEVVRYWRNYRVHETQEWKDKSFGITARRLRGEFENLKPKHTRLVFVQEDEPVLNKFNQIRNALGDSIFFQRRT